MSTSENESFAEMFAQSESKRPKLPKPGDKVSGVITAVGQKRLTLDLGGGVDGMMELVELSETPVPPQVGERIDGFVLGIENRVAQIGRSVGKGMQASAAIEQAAAARVPIEGTISGVNKGGYVVEIGSTRCFCPLGQMDLRRIEDPTTLVGKKLAFLVTEMKGRDVVLSRRALLEGEQKQAREATLAKLQVGATLEGIVVNVRDFGAFVDIGGVEGLIPVSELGYGRAKAQDAVKVGERVRVSVLRIEGPERISLSIRALMDDPFEAALAGLQPGQLVQGKVTSIQAFGAFVELQPGVEGLIHISRFGKRVESAAEVVQIGETVSARIEKIEDRKISLAYFDPTKVVDVPVLTPRKPTIKPQVGQVLTCTVDKIETFGVFVTFESGRGLVPTKELGANVRAGDLRKSFPVGTEFRAVILEVRPDGKVRLSKQATEAAEERAEADAFLQSQSQTPSFGAFASKLAQALKR